MDPESRLKTRLCLTCQAHHAGSDEGRECSHHRDGDAGELLGAVLDGRFQIEAILGDGGMGTIYKARHILLSKLVAIKVLHPRQDELARRRFLQEARAASSLHHANIVDICDYGVLASKRPYLVMELFEGQTLGKAMVEGPLPALRACRIAAQIAHGLQAVHQRGIVHRDLKPENVFLVHQDGQDDFVKIFDFGIAKVLSGPRLTQVGLGPVRTQPADHPDHVLSAEQFTREGAVLGTPEYMSPEQVVGWEIDHRTDQYALGCILYEMLTGAIPFNDPNLDVILRRHAIEPVIPMRERRPDLDIPVALDKLVLRTLAKKREDRFPSMEDLEQALRQLIDAHERAVSVSEDPVAHDPPVPAPRTRRMASGLTAGGALLCLVMTGPFWLVRRAAEGPAKAEAQAALVSPVPVSPVPARPPVALVPPTGMPMPERPHPIVVRFTVPPRFKDGVQISCAPGHKLRCRERCQIELSHSEQHCVASYPGYVRRHLQLRRPAPARGRPAVVTENIALRACLMTPGEECESAQRSGPHAE